MRLPLPSSFCYFWIFYYNLNSKKNQGITVANNKIVFIFNKKSYIKNIDIWMGESPQRLVGKAYTHFPDKFMGEQMDNVEFPTLKTRGK